VLTEAARVQVCGTTEEVGAIAATGDAVAVICSEQPIWDPATDALPGGMVHVARGGGAFTLLSVILPNVSLGNVVLAGGADLFVLNQVGIYRVGPTANGAVSCSIGTPSAGAVAGGNVYFGTETGINSGFVDGVYRTPLDGCLPCRVGCVPAHLAKTPRHPFGGVYWAVSGALRSASPGHAPITAFSSPETISAVFAGNGQPNVYVGTQGGNLSTLR
jgi:hypothetical protein